MTHSRRLNTFFISLVLAFSTPLIAQESDQEKEDELWKLLNNGAYEVAAENLRNIIATDSTEATWFYMLGICYQELNMPRGAFAQYSYAIDLNPGHIQALNSRGVVNYSRGRFSDAIKDYSRALEYEKEDEKRASLLMNRANAKSALRDFEAAYIDLKQAYTLDSTSTAILNNLGTLVDEFGETELSLQYFNKVLELDSGFVEVYNNIGFAYITLEQYEEAIAYFDQVIDLRPELAQGYNNRGFCLYKLGRLDAALSDIDRSLVLYPSNSYAFRNRALVYLALEQVQQACLDLQDALKFGFTTMYGDEVLDLMLSHCN